MVNCNCGMFRATCFLRNTATLPGSRDMHYICFCISLAAWSLSSNMYSPPGLKMCIMIISTSHLQPDCFLQNLAASPGSRYMNYNTLFCLSGCVHCNHFKTSPATCCPSTKYSCTSRVDYSLNCFCIYVCLILFCLSGYVANNDLDRKNFPILVVGGKRLWVEGTTNPS